MSAWAITSSITSTWARLAISGTTPPKRAWRSAWLDTTDERTRRPSSTTAAAVSSHDVSIARIRTLGFITSPRRRPVVDGRAAHAALDAVEQRRVRLGVHFVRPHDERVLAGIDVVALAYADRNEPEPAIQILRALVRQARFERERGGVARNRLVREREQQTRPDLVALPLG